MNKVCDVHDNTKGYPHILSALQSSAGWHTDLLDSTIYSQVAEQQGPAVGLKKT